MSPHRDQRAHPSEVIATVQVEEEGEPDIMGDEEARSLVRRQMTEALNWREQHLDPLQEKATKYYQGQPFGDEEEGRSQVVMPVVRDVVQAIMPSLMRVFFGSERVVEYKPEGPEDVALSEQQTDYVNYVVQEDNSGYLTFHSFFKDALVRKLGVVKWWWEDKFEVEGYESTGLSAEAVAALRLDPSLEVDLLNATDEQLLGEEEPPEGGFDVELLRYKDDGRARIAAVPPEEFIFSPEARDLDSAMLVGHVRDVPASELIAMGVPEEVVERNKHSERDRLKDSTVARARRIDGGAIEPGEHGERDESTALIRFAELYVQIDLDDDGVAELRKMECVGEQCEIVNGDGRGEIVDMAPFALFEPDPEPHTIIGMCPADLVTDLQRIQSHLWRGVLDSMTQTLNPVTEAVPSQVNMSDLLSKEIGKIVRVKQPGQMREVVTPFVGKEALPVIQHLKGEQEDRTGISKAAAGLDPDALQSSTASAVNATISQAQQRIELIARNFAETGMTRLMKGLLRLVTQHQDEARMVRLRNEFVEVDPRAWNADKDVVVNVALGTGLVEEKMQWLSLIASKQEMLLEQGAPLVSLSQLRNTYARMAGLAGFKNPDEFFQPFGPEQDAQFAQQQAQSAGEPPPDVQAAMEVERLKIQSDAQQKAAENRLKLAELELEREKVAREQGRKEAELELKAGESAVDRQIEQARLEIEKATKQAETAKKLSETRVGE